MATQWNYDFSPGQVLTATVMDSLGAVWESWTPQFWNGTGQVTTSVASGFYGRIGKLGIIYANMVANAAGTGGMVECRNIPAAVAPKRTGGTNNNNGVELGSAGVLDAGNIYYVGSSYFNAAAVVRAIVTTNGVDAQFTVASGDKFTFTLVYEIA